MARAKRYPLHVLVYPSNFVGKNGHKMLYVASNTNDEISLEELDKYCHDYESLPQGYVTRCFQALMWAIPHLIGEHKRVKTPLGSFYVKPQFARTITDDEKVSAKDIWLGGIDFRPSKAFRDAVQDQFESIVIDHRKHSVDTAYYSQKNADLEACLSNGVAGNRYVTVEEYSRETGLSYKTAKKCLDLMTEGDNPLLKKTRIGRMNIYTEL